jgi:hypothetical protein
MPLRARDKIIYISYIYFNKGGFIIKPNFKAFNNKAI